MVDLLPCSAFPAAPLQSDLIYSSVVTDLSFGGVPGAPVLVFGVAASGIGLVYGSSGRLVQRSS